MTKRGWSFSRQLLWICFSAVNCQSSNCRPTPSQWWQKCAQTKISLLVTKNLHNWYDIVTKFVWQWLWSALLPLPCHEHLPFTKACYKILSKFEAHLLVQFWLIEYGATEEEERHVKAQMSHVWLIYTLLSTDALTVVLSTSISLIHPLKVSPRVQFILCKNNFIVSCF